VALNQVRLLNMSGITSPGKSRHDVPGMCLKQRRGRGRKNFVKELVLRLRRTRRPGIEGLVSQESPRRDSPKQWGDRWAALAMVLKPLSKREIGEDKKTGCRLKLSSNSIGGEDGEPGARLICKAGGGACHQTRARLRASS
jgi:hypothetical protein